MSLRDRLDRLERRGALPPAGAVWTPAEIVIPGGEPGGHWRDPRQPRDPIPDLPPETEGLSDGIHQEPTPCP